MKHLFKLISVTIVLLTFSFIVSASNPIGPSIEYSEAGITIQFEADTSLSSEMMHTVADSIALDIPVAQTYSLCWLTGHDTITETVTATYHKEHTYSPRCRLDIYLITTCANCDYYVEELSSSGYITCCPED